MQTERRQPHVVKKLVLDAKELIVGGMTQAAALEKVGLAKSVYERGVKKLSNGGAHGAIDVRSLPPRPKSKKGGKRVPKVLNLMDVGAVANRIAKLDAKLATVEGLRAERKRLAVQLRKLLKV